MKNLNFYSALLIGGALTLTSCQQSSLEEVNSLDGLGIETTQQKENSMLNRNRSTNINSFSEIEGTWLLQQISEDGTWKNIKRIPYGFFGSTFSYGGVNLIFSNNEVKTESKDGSGRLLGKYPVEMIPSGSFAGAPWSWLQINDEWKYRPFLSDDKLELTITVFETGVDQIKRKTLKFRKKTFVDNPSDKLLNNSPSFEQIEGDWLLKEVSKDNGTTWRSSRGVPIGFYGDTFNYGTNILTLSSGQATAKYKRGEFIRKGQTFNSSVIKSPNSNFPGSPFAPYNILKIGDWKYRVQLSPDNELLLTPISTNKNLGTFKFVVL
ncbi:protein of unknown function [Tenacibaculum sp. 190524A02b]|uniref:Lipocalin-like domain-containing protein n=1 Tax=Tenacibaculum vairaonense TaxID=3137860 RepID=A0ABP1FEN7_9FLAO